MKTPCGIPAGLSVSAQDEPPDNLQPNTLRTLYDPASWADAAWLAHYCIDINWPKRFANGLLLRRASLRPVPARQLRRTESRWLLANWQVLPAITYLTGSRLLRNTQLAGNTMRQLHHNAARFLSLPLVDAVWRAPPGQPHCRHSTGLDIHQLTTAAGIWCLRTAWKDLAPGWLDRLRLRLPPQAWIEDPKSPTLFAVPLPPSASCLRLIGHATRFHHAQNH